MLVIIKYISHFSCVLSLWISFLVVFGVSHEWHGMKGATHDGNGRYKEYSIHTHNTYEAQLRIYFKKGTNSNKQCQCGIVPWHVRDASVNFVFKFTMIAVHFRSLHLLDGSEV